MSDDRIRWSGNPREGSSMRQIARFLGAVTAKRLAALDDNKQAGGFNRFEEKMLGLARDELENEDGSAALAGYILYYLAEAAGVRIDD